MKNILAVTGSPADWGLMDALLQQLLDVEGIHVTLLVLGDHKVGCIYETAMNVELVRLAPMLGEYDMALQASVAAASAAMFFSRMTHPIDDIVLLGDRVEIIAFAVLAALHGAPIHHLWAGDRSGCVDDYYRDAISMLSTHLYAVSSNAYRRAIDLMLATDKRIKTVSLVAPPMTVDTSQTPKEPYAVARWHPETMQHEPYERWITEAVTKAISEQIKLLILPPNTDDGWRKIDTIIKSAAVAYPHWVQVLRDPLPRPEYLGLLKNAQWVRGNSSSFLLEAPLVGQKVIIVEGTRQALRDVPNPHGIPMIDQLLENIL